MSFSIAGIVVALAILGPTLVLLAFPPRKGTIPSSDAGVVFTILERAGQIGCLFAVVFLAKLFPAPFGTADTVLLTVLALATLAYWVLWVRYVASRDAWTLFAPVFHIPIPMAVLPVLAFAAAAGLSRSPYLAAATAVLAVGHGANSWHAYSTLKSDVGSEAPGARDP